MHHVGQGEHELERKWGVRKRELVGKDVQEATGRVMEVVRCYVRSTMQVRRCSMYGMSIEGLEEGVTYLSDLLTSYFTFWGSQHGRLQMVIVWHLVTDRVNHHQEPSSQSCGSSGLGCLEF